MEVRPEEVADRLISLVKQVSGSATVFPSPFPVETQLSDLGMTSLKMVNLMLAVEVEFDIAIPQTDITPENFQSLGSIQLWCSGYSACGDSEGRHQHFDVRLRDLAMRRADPHHVATLEQVVGATHARPEVDHPAYQGAHVAGSGRQHIEHRERRIVGDRPAERDQPLAHVVR